MSRTLWISTLLYKEETSWTWANWSLIRCLINTTWTSVFNRMLWWTLSKTVSWALRMYFVNPFKIYSCNNKTVVFSSCCENLNIQTWSPCRRFFCPTATGRCGSSSTMQSTTFGWVFLATHNTSAPPALSQHKDLHSHSLKLFFIFGAETFSP